MVSGAGKRERRVDPADGVGVAMAHPPVARERGAHGERPLGLRAGDGPAERGVEVLDVGIERAEVRLAARHRRARARCRRARRTRGSGRSGARGRPRHQATPRSARRRTRGSSRASPAGVSIAVPPDQQALGDQAVDRVQVGAGDRLDRIDGRAAGEHGEAGERRPLVIVEQVVAPIDRRSQRALALGRVTRAGAERAQRRVAAAARSRRAPAASSAQPPARSRAADRPGVRRSR